MGEFLWCICFKIRFGQNDDGLNISLGLSYTVLSIDQKLPTVAARHCEREKTMKSLKSIGQIFI